ncbi:MAG: hypothetical protein HOP20_08585 [Sulfuriferula sp.]|nr:hypothetical protein [Sulfuriferula sp.]
MLRTYFVDSGAGGCGVTFNSRCIVEMLLQQKQNRIEKIYVVDVFALYTDLCNETYGLRDDIVDGVCVFAINHRITCVDDWFSCVSLLDELGAFDQTSNTRIVFSASRYASMLFAENSMLVNLLQTLNVVHVWTLGTTEYSVSNLANKVRDYPLFYSNGIVVRNLKNGNAEDFIFWNGSELEKKLRGYGWHVVDEPLVSGENNTARLANRNLHDLFAIFEKTDFDGSNNA